MKLKLLNTLQDAVIKAPLHFEFGGVTFKFTAHIKLLDTPQIDELTSNNTKTDQQIARELLVGWDGFIDEGQPVPFSSDVLEQLLVYGGIAGRITAECVNAQYRVQEKN